MVASAVASVVALVAVVTSAAVVAAVVAPAVASVAVVASAAVAVASVHPVAENPPDCSGTQDTVSFPDSAPVGYCSNVTVWCTTAGSDALLTATNSTSGPVAWAVSQGDPSTDSMLDFAVCVTDVLFHLVGQYQVSRPTLYH